MDPSISQALQDALDAGQTSKAPLEPQCDPEAIRGSLNDYMKTSAHLAPGVPIAAAGPANGPEFEALCAGVEADLRGDFERFIGKPHPYPDLGQRVREWLANPVGRAVMRSRISGAGLDDALKRALCHILASEVQADQSDQAGMAEQVFDPRGRREMTWLAFREALREAWGLKTLSVAAINQSFLGCTADTTGARLLDDMGLRNVEAVQKALRRRATLGERWHYFRTRFAQLRAQYGGLPR